MEKGLPPKKETILKIGMSDMQKETYKQLLQKDLQAVSGGADRCNMPDLCLTFQAAVDQHCVLLINTCLHTAISKGHALLSNDNPQQSFLLD